MQADPNERTGNSELFCADRIGFANLTTMAFHGIDLRPLRDQLISKVAGETAGEAPGAELLAGDAEGRAEPDGVALAAGRAFSFAGETAGEEHKPQAPP